MTSPKKSRILINVIILMGLLGLVSYLIKVAWRTPSSVPAAGPASAAGRLQTQPQVEEVRILKAPQVKYLLDRHEKVVILDIQERSKFKEAHIPSAINIPSDELGVRAQDELSTADRIIIVDCACDGTNSVSLLMRTALIKLGFKDIAILDEGLNGWKALSFSLVSERD